MPGALRANENCAASRDRSSTGVRRRRRFSAIAHPGEVFERAPPGARAEELSNAREAAAVAAR